MSLMDLRSSLGLEVVGIPPCLRWFLCCCCFKAFRRKQLNMKKREFLSRYSCCCGSYSWFNSRTERTCMLHNMSTNHRCTECCFYTNSQRRVLPTYTFSMNASCFYTVEYLQQQRWCALQCLASSGIQLNKTTE